MLLDMIQTQVQNKVRSRGDSKSHLPSCEPVSCGVRVQYITRTATAASMSVLLLTNSSQCGINGERLLNVCQCFFSLVSGFKLDNRSSRITKSVFV